MATWLKISQSHPHFMVRLLASKWPPKAPVPKMLRAPQMKTPHRLHRPYILLNSKLPHQLQLPNQLQLPHQLQRNKLCHLLPKQLYR